MSRTPLERRLAAADPLAWANAAELPAALRARVLAEAGSGATASTTVTTRPRRAVFVAVAAGVLGVAIAGGIALGATWGAS